MKLSKNKYNNKFSEIYLLLYSIYIIIVTISKFTAYSKYLHPIYKLVVALFILINLIFLFFIKSSNNLKNYYVDFLIIFISLIIILFRLTLNIQIITFPLLCIYLFIANLRYVNLNKFIDIDFKTKLFLIITIFICYLCHLTPYIPILYRNGLPRISGGFVNYNGFAGAILCLMLSYILYLDKHSLSINHICIIGFTLLIAFLVTDSRGLMYSGVLLVLLLIILNFKIISNFIRKLPILFFIVCASVAIMIPLKITYENPNFTYYNKFFSNRLSLQNLATEYFPIRWTGYDTSSLGILKNYTDISVYVDNTYLMLLITCGILGFMIFTFLMIKASCIASYNNEFIVCMLLIVLFSYMTIETTFFNISFYVPIIYIFILNKMHTNYKKD